MFKALPPKAKGEISEIVVMAELIKLGYRVSKPFGDNAPYDLIVESHKGKLLKIQIKTVNFQGNRGKIALKKTRINSKHYVISTYDKKDVDYFMAYCFEMNKVYMFKNCYKSKILTLRFEASREKRSLYAKDFELKRDSIH